jgi:tetratricopeptide (TPR) repeat protein
VAIALAVAVAHGGALRAGFVAFDDDHYVYLNPVVAQGLSGESAAWAFSLDRERTYFHPLTWLSLMLDAELFGVEPWGFHLVNLLLHAISAVLLFRFLARATGRTAGPLLAALLFAAHPVTVEAVAWISERKAVLSTALAMGSIVAWGAYARRPSAARYALAAALFLLALLAKPGVVALPLVLLALDAWPLRRAPWPFSPGRTAAWRRLALEKVPLLAMGLAVVALAMVSFETAAAGAPAPPSLRVANALASIGTYLRVAFWPSGLALIHPFPQAAPVMMAALGAAILGAGTLAGVRLADRAPYVLAGWCWFVLALGPYLGLVQNGLWPAWAERFAYLALPGIAVAVGFGVAELAGTPVRAGAIALALLVPLAVRTRAQVAVWKDSVSLFTAASIEPGACEVQLGLGRALLVEGRYPEAEATLRTTLARCPPAAPTHAVLGMALYAQEHFFEAEGELRRALRLAPEDPGALHYLSLLLWRTGRREEARPVLETFVRVAPPNLLEAFLERAPGDMIAARAAARSRLGR